jgi:hypothetical protein
MIVVMGVGVATLVFCTLAIILLFMADARL